MASEAQQTPPPAVIPTAGARSGMPRRRLVSLAVAGIVVLSGLVIIRYDVDHPSEAPPIPLGTALSLGNGSVGSGPHPTVWYWHYDVQSVAPSLSLACITFSVQTTGGTNVPAPPGSGIDLMSVTTGASLGNYTFANSSWSGVSPSMSVTTTLIFLVEWVETTATDPLSGDLFTVTGHDGFSGTTTYVMA